MHAFENTSAEQLPVIDEDARLVGYIYKAQLYSRYRKMVADLSTE